MTPVMRPARQATAASPNRAGQGVGPQKALRLISDFPRLPNVTFSVSFTA